MRIDTSKVTETDLEEASKENDLDMACVWIQDIIGQNDGGIAGLYFADVSTDTKSSNEIWSESSQSERKRMLQEYLKLEQGYSSEETDIEDVILEVDTHVTSLREYININVVDTPQLTCEFLISVLSLKVGECISGGMGADVKRIK